MKTYIEDKLTVIEQIEQSHKLKLIKRIPHYDNNSLQWQWQRQQQQMMSQQQASGSSWLDMIGGLGAGIGRASGDT